MGRRALIVVDVQRDFYSPEGSLYVKGGESLPERIAEIIPDYDTVIFTLDFHPYNHCSFKTQGGIWPVHCVEYTDGAALPVCLLSVCDRQHQNVFFIRKGQDSSMEEYGAFTSPEDLLKILGEDVGDCKVDICGIAGDYCVRETTSNVLKVLSSSNVHILKEYCVSIDGGEVLDNFVKENLR